jgi:hypothetical protein
VTKRGDGVPRPLKKSEFELRFATAQAAKGWRDLLATYRNSTVDAWDYLTSTPFAESSRHHRLKGELAHVNRDGQTHERWQHEMPGGARIWFYVDGSYVFLVDVHTRHPNQTK